MKKYIMNFLSVIFLIMILLIPSQKVDADELETKTYDYNNSDVINGYYEKFKVQMEEVKTYLDNYKNDYYYLIYFNNTSVNVYLYEKKDNFDINLFLSSSSSTLAHGLTGSTINYINFSFNNTTFETNFNTFKNNLENSNFNSRSNMSSSASTFNNGLIRDTFSRVYYTNFDNFRLREDSVFNLSINGDILIKPGEKVPTYYDFIGSSKFNELISTSEYGGMIFTFDTSNYENYLDNNSLLFDYDFYVSDKDYNLLDYSFEVPYFGYNGKDVYSDGSETYSYHVDRLGHSTTNRYQYSYQKNMKYFVSELKLFVYFDTLDDVYVNAYLDSPIPFEVEYLPKDSNFDYYQSVDITGKYGVILKPNQVDDNFVSMIYFEKGGKYSLQIRDTFSATNEEFDILDYYQIGFCNKLDVVGLVPISCTDDYFVSIAKYLSYEKLFFYVRNENYYKSDINSIVYYDSRYYTAYIQNTSSSSVEIVNPETGETEIFGPMINFDDIYYEKNNDTFFKLFGNSFNEFKDVIFEIFENVSYFFERLGIELQYFYIIVFSLIIFIFLIRFLL